MLVLLAVVVEFDTASVSAYLASFPSEYTHTVVQKDSSSRSHYLLFAGLPKVYHRGSEVPFGNIGL